MLIGLGSLELWNLPHLTGFACGIPLIFVGACGGALINYRSERGLWMLSALFAVMVGLFLSFAGFGFITDVARTGFFAEALLVHWGWGFFLLQLLYLFVSLLRVASFNWKISKQLAFSAGPHL